MPSRRLFITAVAALMIAAGGCSSIVKDGRKMLYTGQYDGAIALFERHLSDQPEDWKTREQLAYALLKNGQYKESIQEFETVRRQRPKTPDTHLYLGLAYLRARQLEKGIETWKDFLDVGSSKQVREVRRLLTLLEIAESRKFAANVIARGNGNQGGSGSRSHLAVLYYNDLSAEKGLRTVQKSLAAMIISDLSRVKDFTVVSRLQMDALLSAVAFSQTGLVKESDVATAGQFLGAEYMLYGTLSTLLRDLRVNTTISRSSSGAVVGTFLYSDILDSFYELQKKVVFSALERIRYPVSETQKKEIADPHTEDFNAFLHFGRGLDALDAGEWETARVFFAQAVEEDSGFDLAREAMETCPTGVGIAFDPISKMGVDAEANRIVTDRLEEIVEGLAAFPDS